MKNPNEINVLIGCEESQNVCVEFRKLGVNAYSCDIQECSGGFPEYHLHMDVFKAISGGVLTTQSGEEIYIDKWDIGIFHPDCTFLTVTANKWLKDQPKRKSGSLVGQERRDAVELAANFFMRLVNSGIDHSAIENPIGVMSTRYRVPDQIIHPYQFGHPEPKKTCLWLKGLPLLTPTEIVEPEYFWTKSGKRMPKWSHYLAFSPERKKMRSVTFQGIAKAIAKQYSDYILNNH